MQFNPYLRLNTRRPRQEKRWAQLMRMKCMLENILRSSGRIIRCSRGARSRSKVRREAGEALESGGHRCVGNVSSM